MGAVKFETVLALPPARAGRRLFREAAGRRARHLCHEHRRRRVLQRSGHVQMHVEAFRAAARADTEFGRYYATEALDLLEALSGMRADDRVHERKRAPRAARRRDDRDGDVRARAAGSGDRGPRRAVPPDRSSLQDAGSAGPDARWRRRYVRGTSRLVVDEYGSLIPQGAQEAPHGRQEDGSAPLTRTRTTATRSSSTSPSFTGSSLRKGEVVRFEIPPPPPISISPSTAPSSRTRSRRGRSRTTSSISIPTIRAATRRSTRTRRSRPQGVADGTTVHQVI
jgi:hypothetical protein